MIYLLTSLRGVGPRWTNGVSSFFRYNSRQQQPPLRPRRHSCSIRASSSRRSFSTKFPADTSILFISNLYPEPTASAAGVRTSFFLEKLVQCEGITSVHYASTSPKAPPESNERLETMGINFHVLPPNQSDRTREFLESLPQTDNMLVIFDRFYAEEMFSFQINKHCPNAVLVLDMQDMHSLRHARQDFIRKRDRKEPVSLDSLPLDARPAIDDPRLLRELASIYRSDLTIACSPVERDLLRDYYRIPSDKLCIAPLFGTNNTNTAGTTAAAAPTLMTDRHDFVLVGGFRHDPNVDAVHQLKRLWPSIRAQLDDPNVQLHIYGAYCPSQLQQRLHDPDEGFLVHGFNPSLSDILADKRVMLAPLRFGAGIKGKIVDAWMHGLPVVTTPIGSEGMLLSVSQDDDSCWGGKIALNDDEFVGFAVDLYQNPEQWNTAQHQAGMLLSHLYSDDQWDDLAARLCQALTDRDERRDTDFTRSILWHQSCRSTEYFSRFIELKESHASEK